MLVRKNMSFICILCFQNIANSSGGGAKICIATFRVKLLQGVAKRIVCILFKTSSMDLVKGSIPAI